MTASRNTQHTPAEVPAPRVMLDSNGEPLEPGEALMQAYSDPKREANIAVAEAFDRLADKASVKGKHNGFTERDFRDAADYYRRQSEAR